MSGGRTSMVHVLLHSVWQLVCGLLPFRPLYAGLALVALLVVGLVVGLWAQFTGRARFTLEPVEFQALERKDGTGGS